MGVSIGGQQLEARLQRCGVFCALDKRFFDLKFWGPSLHVPGI